MCSLRGRIQAYRSLPCQLHFSHHDHSLSPSGILSPSPFLLLISFSFARKLQPLVAGELAQAETVSWVLFLRLFRICPLLATSPAVKWGGCRPAVSVAEQQCPSPKSLIARSPIPEGSHYCVAHCRSLRAELGTARGHFESRRGPGLGRQKKLRQMRVGGHSFSARLAFSRPVLSPSLSPRPSSCLISALLSGFLCFISPLPSLLALSGPLSCSAVFPSCPHLSRSGSVNLCLCLL